MVADVNLRAHTRKRVVNCRNIPISLIDPVYSDYGGRSADQLHSHPRVRDKGENYANDSHRN